MLAWRRRVKIHLEQLEERVARLEAEMDHVKNQNCKCGQKVGRSDTHSKPGLTEPFGGKIRVNQMPTETRWTHGPDWKVDRP